MKARRVFAATLLLVAAGWGCSQGEDPARTNHPATDFPRPPAAPDAGAPLKVLQAELTLGNRDYIASVLVEIFTPTGKEHDLDPVVREEIRSSLGVFGGACSVYSSAGLSDCSQQRKEQTETTDTTVPFRQASSASREARRLRACERIVDQKPAVAAAIAKVDGASADKVPTSDQTAGAFDLFYPGQPLDPDGKAALDALVADAHGDAAAAWQTLLLALCISPGWQVP